MEAEMNRQMDYQVEFYSCEEDINIFFASLRLCAFALGSSWRLCVDFGGSKEFLQINRRCPLLYRKYSVPVKGLRLRRLPPAFQKPDAALW